MRTLTSIDETLACGREIAATLRHGDVIALCGPMGAGKTHLTQGIVAGLGSTAPVTSPTFTLVNEYRDGRLPVYHLDFYRMESPRELLAIGWDELLETDGVVIAEWADRFPELMPPGTRWLRLALAGESRTLDSDSGPESHAE